MKIKNMIQVSTLALMLGTTVTFASFEVFSAKKDVDEVKSKSPIEVDTRLGNITAHNHDDAKTVIRAVSESHKEVAFVGVRVKPSSDLAEKLEKIPKVWGENSTGESSQRFFATGKSKDAIFSLIKSVPPTDKLKVFKIALANPGDVVKVAKIVKDTGKIVQTNLPKVEGDAKSGENVLHQVKQDATSSQSTIKSDENTVHNINNDINDAPNVAGSDIDHEIVGGLTTGGDDIKGGIVSTGNKIAGGFQSVGNEIESWF